jgi:hypothetical protein
MTTNMVDRKTVREAFAALLAAALVGDGKPVEAVYAYQVSDFQGKSPVVFITSAGSFRRNPERSTRSTSIAYFDVNVMVLYSDSDADWTEQDSEDCLDLIEKSVAQIVANNGRDDALPWMELDFSARSEVTSVVIGGKDYSWEIIPLAAVLWGA